MSAAPYDPSVSARLQELLLQARKAAPMLEAGSPVLRRHAGLSQARMARALGVSTKWYRLLEIGAAAWTPERVEAAALALGLSSPQRVVFYRLALGYEPPTGALSTLEQQQNTKILIDASPFPAQITDEYGNVIYANRLFIEWFPCEGERQNAFKAMLCHPLMRERLVEWERDWALPILASLRGLSLRLPPPGQRKIRTLLGDIREQAPDVSRMWERAYYGYPAPTSRQLMVDARVVDIHAVNANPLGYPPGCEMKFVIPDTVIAPPAEPDLGARVMHGQARTVGAASVQRSARQNRAMVRAPR